MSHESLHARLRRGASAPLASLVSSQVPSPLLLTVRLAGAASA